MRRLKKKYSFIIFIFSLGIVFGYTLHSYIDPASIENINTNLKADVVTPTIFKEQVELKVKRVIDGDTIELEGGLRVRYIGINTPELHSKNKELSCYGKEAKDKNKELVEGKNIRLEKDISEIDKYGRLLRYVYVLNKDSEELFINKYLVEQGYAYVSTFPPDVKYSELLKEMQNKAQEENKGLWSKCKD